MADPVLTAKPATPKLETATLAEVRAAVASGRTTLFLGAGPSCALGGPSWSQLEGLVAEKFVDAGVRSEIQGRGWWDLMDFICETLDQRPAVEEFIRRKLEQVGVEPWFEQLLQASWEKVYTTNYDDVATRANDVAQSGPARFESYYGGRLPFNPLSTERPIIKIMGDVRESYPSKGAMILCRSDLSLNATAEAYRTTVQTLRDDIDAGMNVVVLGQSLEDRILVSVLTDIVRTRGSKPAGELFLVSKRPPRWDIQMALAKLKPKFVEATAQALSESVKGVEGPLPPERGLRLTIKGRPVNLGPHVLRLLDGTGVLIDAATAGTKFAGADDFLARSAYSKEAFDKNWDFKRTLHQLRADGKAVVSQVSISLAMAELLGGTRGKTAIVSGPPGAAKTMTALRLAHDWVASGGIALVIDAATSADGTVAADCLHGIEQEILSQTDLGQEAVRQVLVVIDNAGRNRRFVDRFRTTCMARRLQGHTTILTCKPPQIDPFLPFASIAWELAPRLDLAELNRLADYARGLPHPPTAMEIDLVKTRANQLGFWGALYQLAEPSRKPLEQSILGHCQGLDPWAQDIAAYAACFETLGMPLPLIILSRIVTEKNRMELRQEIDGGMLGQVTFIGRYGDFDCVRFVNPQSAAHVAGEWRSKQPPYSMIHTYISSVGGSNEQAPVIQWLIHGLAQRDDPPGSVAARLLSLSDLESLMSEASDRFPTAATIHHHGRMLRKLHRYDKALRRLEQAIRHPEAYGEKSHIAHGIAVTCVRWADELIIAQKTDTVPELLDRAEENLRDASLDRPTFVYAIRAELLMCRSKVETDPAKRKQLVANAYVQAKFGQLFAREDKAKNEAARVLSKVLSAMGFAVTTSAEAIALARDQKTAAGVHKLVDSELGEGPWSRHANAKLTAAAQLIEQSMEFVSSDPLLHNHRARLELLLDPQSPKLDGMLENLEAMGMADEALLMRAVVQASRGQLPAMRGALASLRERFAGFEVPVERRQEFLVRSKTGPVVYEVRAGTPNWLQLGGERVPASNWTPGEKVHLEIQPTGPLLRIAM